MSQTSTDPQFCADPPQAETDRLTLTSMALRQVGHLDALQQITLAVARAVDVEAELPHIQREIRDRLGLKSVRITMPAERQDIPAAADEGEESYSTPGQARLPVLIDSRPAATLEVEMREGECPDRETLDLLSQVADVIGVGILRTRRQRGVHRQPLPEEPAGAFLEIVTRLTAQPGISSDLQSVLDDVAAAFEFSCIRLMIHDDDDLLYLASPTSNQHDDSRELVRLLSSRAVQEVMDQHEQRLVSASPGNPAYLRASENAAQALITPIMVSNVAAGVLVLELEGDRPIRQSDREIPSQLARHLSLIVQRERRIERYSRQNLLLSLVERVTAVIARSVTADDLLNRIAREIRRTFGYNCSIGTIENGRLYFPALEIAGQVETPPWASEGIPLSLGVTGRVARTGEPAFIRNVEDEPVFIDIGVGTTSEICVPVRIEGEVVGVVNVESGAGNELDEMDFEVISMVASHLGIALYNQRLIASERERRREIEAFQQVSTIIAETLDPDEAMRRVADTLHERLDYPFVTLATLEGDDLVLRAGRGCELELMPPSLPITDGISGRTVRTGEPVFVEDVRQDPDYVPARPDVTSEVCVPIRCAGEIVGILNVEGTADRPLTGRDRDLLMTFAEHAGVLLNNARAYAEVSRQATLDPVTGIPNHRYFQDQLQAEIETAEKTGTPLSLLVVDLDGFKEVNDRFGHLAGDQMLRDIAARMAAQIRAEDMLARYAGDEFVVLLPGMDGEQSLDVARRLLDAARSTAIRIHDGQSQTITLSIGIASYPDDATTPTEILRAADMAMYMAKDSGKDAVSVSGDVTLVRRDRRGQRAG